MYVLEQVIVLEVPIETDIRGEKVDIGGEEQKEKSPTEPQAGEPAETPWRNLEQKK